MTADRQARCFDLEFGVDGRGRSFLGAQFVRYPVHVCRGLRVDAHDPDLCSVALQSVSGGLFEGDHVAGSLVARTGARARVSTSASTIVHRMRGDAGARQSVTLQAHEGARLEYLPEPLILFPGSRLRSDTCVHLADDARVLLCDSFLLHDPQAAARAFETLDVRVEVRDLAGRLRARERMLLHGAAWADARKGIPGHPLVHASLWLLGAGAADLIGPVRAALQDTGTFAGASELPNGIGVQVRMLAEDAVGLRQCLDAVLDRARSEAAIH